MSKTVAEDSQMMPLDSKEAGTPTENGKEDSSEVELVAKVISYYEWQTKHHKWLNSLMQ